MSRTVLVTGASRGIGAAVVARFVALGDRVVAVGRDRDALRGVAEAATGGGVTPVACDVTDEAAVAAVVAEAGDVDVLVCNAGIGETAPLHRTTLADWERHMAVNATGAFLFARAVVERMRRDGAGRIVFVASVAGRIGAPYTAAYSASKHAMVGLMRATAAELAGTGATANAVCPTFVETELVGRAVENITAKTGRSADEARAVLEAASPLGRLLEPDEVAASVVWLASHDARSINGQAIVMDGGGIQA